VQELIRRKELLKRLKISNTTLYAWIKSGRFPRPIEGGSEIVTYWLASDVDKWFADRVVARDRVAARGEPLRASA
jgi:prophage regulatory protein